ncbi:FAD/FMN-containing dehydrogenase/Fe-S oxidoreductase [Paenarthrobacter nicotinovorans]|uniref:FAD-binding and (Fe-S)-binding domain-containing protein n=1 Tax=Micrococcaceae TaxID=1268 RepID=UPI000876CAA5|nr:MULTISPECIES: FAD-binding and (Fe-S)-binding domain-containing protein [Micrococcaceae]MDR6438665.1 FAD/FMN-containing dehydrogenase/Fe-S oxidoreductase [Paenarthrobacter nicotinovorans]SCZ56615.1 FAD/FMN-containing dehydrogenase [Arthrobacter sp. UNCCL28]
MTPSASRPLLHGPEPLPHRTFIVGPSADPLDGAVVEDSSPVTALLGKLAEAGVPVDASARRLSEYSYDASNYRVQPLAVAFPRTVEDVVAAVASCRATGIPLIARGGGTSMAGNAVGPGLILDFSRHMNHVFAIDEATGTVNVEPGVILASLSREVEQATEGRCTFAPDPSSKNRATVGGAIGNDACGNHSVRYGRTSDHVSEIDLVTSDGARLTATETGLRATHPDDSFSVARAEALATSLAQMAQENLSTFRLEFGCIPRQVSGYHLENLLPEKKFNIARAVVGSEGTWAIVVGARMKLVPKPAAALLVCLGYEDVVDAARDIPAILEFSPAAVEGTDEAIVDTMRHRRGPNSVLGLPEGRAWLFVDLDGDDINSVRAQAELLLTRLAQDGRLVQGRLAPDPAERASLWRVREDGAGLSSRLASGGESWPGWEDSAVAPERLADYLADLRGLLAEHNLTGVMYGHFGAGCMHVRITYDLRSEEGREVFRTFTRRAAELVVRHGGSLSGEHGDGRARSELLPLMYSPDVMAAFSECRRLWDPVGILNPGSMTDPDPMDAHLALAGIPDREWRTSFDLRPVGSSGTDPWVQSVQGCIGVGRCRADSGGVMCPSYKATRDEKDSTRGRSRVLQDMVRGARTVEEGWKSEEVREVLDLCLACKACSTDCPAGVDMATYKSEFFDHYYRGRLRPLAHFSLGWLPRWLKLTGRMSGLVNAVLATPLGKVAAAAGGLTTKRALPRFAGAGEWRREVTNAGIGAASQADSGDSVVLFVDTFTRGFRPEVAGAAARVLADAGNTVECSADACCGLTWISTGQLGTAKRLLSRAAEVLDDGTDRPIVVVEPSCAAALRKDLPELVHTEQAKRVAARVRSFAAHAADRVASGWIPSPARPAPQQAVLQTHCHEYSVFGAAAQRTTLTAAGVAQVIDADGCCGVAGNFGFEANHYEVSMQVAENALAPALRATGHDVAVLTDGFSCARQIDQLDATRPGLHLAQILDPGPGTVPGSSSTTKDHHTKETEELP